MNKRLIFYIFSLLITLTIIITPQTLKADEDVCVWHNTLNNQDDANAICPGVCTAAIPNYEWNGQWNIPQYAPAKCTSFWWGKVSVCGCKPVKCHCEKGSQVECDESLNPGGPNQCTTNCNCTEGRRCINGWCQGTPGLPCCSECRPQYNTCMTLCNGVPIQERGDCESLCGGELNQCTENCQQICSALEKKSKPSQTKEPNKNLVPAVPKSPSKREKTPPSAPPKEKKALSETPTEAPKEKNIIIPRKKETVPSTTQPSLKEPEVTSKIDGDSCADCYSTCMTLCNNVQEEAKENCWSQCETDKTLCDNGIGPCAQMIEQKKRAKKKNKIDQEKSPKKQEKASSRPSPPSKEKGGQNSTE